jgi:hypothetical protein
MICGSVMPGSARFDISQFGVYGARYAEKAIVCIPPWK